MSEKEINKEQLQKEIDQELNSTILAMAQDPSNADNYHTLAKLYAMDNKFDKVISVYESLLNLHPNDSQALLNLGSIWFFEKEYKKALGYYQKAMDIDQKIILYISIWVTLMLK